MKHLFFFLKFGRIITLLLFVVQVVYVIFSDKDLITFLDYPKSLTFALFCGFAYALSEYEEYSTKKSHEKSKIENDLNSNS